MLLDLDGTISESGPMIVAALRETLAELGLPGPDDDAYREVVGPPLTVSLRQLFGLSPEQIAQVIPRYRALQRSRLHAVPAYDGVPDLIRDLAGAGLPLAVATSKVVTTAEEVIEGYGLRECFVAVCGAPVGEAGGLKHLVVGEALRQLRAAGCDVDHPVMVGDRHHDVVGAGAHDIPTIAVTWGYGSPAEWEDAAGVARTPQDLAALLGWEHVFARSLRSNA